MTLDRERKWNIVLILLCIILCAVLAGLFVWNKKSEVKESKRLEEVAAGKAVSGNKKEKAAKTDEETPQKKEEEQEVPEEKEAEIEGIVCWGDDMINGEESATYSYKVVLQKLLQENGYNLLVQDKTLQGAGTMSMMTMAGVPKEKVDGFITRHVEAAQGSELPITETGIRDLTPEQLARTDLNCVPIISMGYYGGWSHDPAELAEQQQAILDTFPSQEQFLIVGAIPIDGSVDAATLDSVMKEKWGEHYISAAEISSRPAATYEGQEAIANAVFQKLEELKYIQKEG